MIDCYYTDQRQRWWQRDNIKVGDPPQNQAYDTTCLGGLTTKPCSKRETRTGGAKSGGRIEPLEKPLGSREFGRKWKLIVDFACSFSLDVFMCLLPLFAVQKK